MSIVGRAGPLLSALSANTMNLQKAALRLENDAMRAWGTAAGLKGRGLSNALRTRAGRGWIYGGRRNSYLKGLGMHAMAGAVIGGGMSYSNGESVTRGAMRGAMYGGMLGVGASAFRNRSAIGMMGRAAGKDMRAYIASKGAL